MEFKNIKEIINSIKSKELSPREVTEYYLNRISKHNHKFNAFITILEDEALKRAKEAESEILNGVYKGPLHGIPYAAKDIINTSGTRTTNGSALYKDFIPEHDAFCISKMKDAGAILLGKTNTHQYAAASTTINVHFGTTRNPHNPLKIVGGSSGGSAAAVASKFVPISLGTDTGGSIRTPSSLCGIVGLKPTHGAISLSGVFPTSPRIDHVGPMCESVYSTALAYSTLAGYDQNDMKSVEHKKIDLSQLENDIKGLKIAICPDIYQNQELDGEVEGAYEQAKSLLEDLGTSITTINFEDVDIIQDLFYGIAGPEFTKVHIKQYSENPESFDPDVRKRMEWSVKVDIDDYLTALDNKIKMTRLIENKIKKFDALITPATPFTAPLIEGLNAKINQKNYDYTANLHRQFFSPFNVTGLPALVLPIGRDKSNMPIAMQIVGRKWDESKILQIAHNIEANIMYNNNISF